MMSAVITVMRKVIRGILAPTRKSVGIKCFLKRISLSVTTEPRVASSQSCHLAKDHAAWKKSKEGAKKTSGTNKCSRNRNKNRNNTTPTAAVTIQEDWFARDSKDIDDVLKSFKEDGDKYNWEMTEE
eukprot:5430229-Ditylum_brightwellii.AAC.1